MLVTMVLKDSRAHFHRVLKAQKVLKEFRAAFKVIRVM